MMRQDRFTEGAQEVLAARQAFLEMAIRAEGARP